MRAASDRVRLPAMDECARLRCLLERACARRDSQPPFSPDWDAAMAHLEELSRRLGRLLLEGARQGEPITAHR